ncbi:alpha/beta fold hydrolase [Nocardiopsis trehalosi]|uniref:alpha/beta fold hydrolase n=1 Tax=Nocardiopsis trehalosi TaxID=109329 RepID=UPI000A02DCF0|nr:alpha/beta fold hydrolase [Nocardiopsis trehalosi]
MTTSSTAGGPGREPDAAGPATHFTVHHGGAAIPVSRGGRGPLLVLCPGLMSTRADLRELIGLLRRDHDVAAFDLRGHGRTPAAPPYTFDAFRGDLTAVLAELARREPAVPVLAGYSLGADLAVHHAAAHPGTVAGLVLIDGANPVPEPFLTEADLPGFRAMWREVAAEYAAQRGTPRQVLLGAEQLLDVNLEVDAVRSTLLDRYRRIDAPVRMIMSTAMAGHGDGAPRYNRNWRLGVERLGRARPQTRVTWVDADHRLVLTHARRIAEIIGDATRPPRGSTP